MKRVVFFSLLFCLVLIASIARAQVPEATALTTNKVITIDGVIDPNEWKGVDPIWVNRDTGIDTTGTPSGDADLSYNLYIAHDGETLYLGFDISDENIQADSGTSTWDDDCVEIFGDADNQGTTQTNDGMGFQLLITTDGRTDGGDQAALGLTGDGWFATQLTDDGWVCEVAIPFTSFDTGGGTPLAVGDSIGFTVNVDDDDDGAGREGQLWWYAVSGDSWDNQGDWGDLVISAELASTVSAGPDQRVVAGTTVTLTGKGPDDTTSFTWTQTGGQEHHVATLQPSPNQAEVQFDTPVVEIGFILTFELTVVSTSEGTVTDDVQITVLAPNEPRVVPGNFRTFVKHLGIRLEWDAILDAEDYGVGLKFGTMYLWFWTDDAYYDLGNLSPGQETIVVVKARNSYGEGVESEEITFTPMANVTLPGEQGGPHPPSEQVYVVSHYNIASMNDAVIEDDSNDSWDGLYKQEDYWGYLWPQAIYMDQVVYFAGNVFSDGGWFTTLKLQYTPDGASWLDVPMSTAPEYNLADEQKGRRSNERFDIFIPTLRGTGIRIYGTPGGTASFTSIAELEVYGLQTRNPLIVQGVDKEVPERTTVTLDGSFTFSTRGDITSMIWEQVSGASVTIELTADPMIATFEAPGVDADTELVFKVTAGDGTETLSDDEVIITVRNLVTTAVAGADQSVKEGTAATLDGFGSLTTTGNLTYQWTQTSGDPVTLNNASAAVAAFEAPVIWGYTEELTFRLEVDDGAGGTSSDEVVVEVRNALASPAWRYTDAAAATTGYMTEMLHLGNNPTDRILDPLNINNDPLAKFGGQAFVNPVPGEQYDFTDTGVTVTRNPMTWTPIHSDSGLFGNEGLDEFEQIYHVYVICPEERPVRFHFRNDDEVRGWNNGALIFSRDAWDNDLENTDDGTLHEGLNSMAFKFEDGTGGNRISVGITDDFDELMTDVWYSLGPSFVLADAYAARELPASYLAGGTIDVTLSVRVNPSNKPSVVTVSESIPAGLNVVDAGGGSVVGGSVTWSFSGAAVGTQVMSYTLGVPGGTTGALHFTGTLGFAGGTEDVKGELVIYEVPSSPQNISVEMLLAGHLSWSSSSEEGVVGYRVYSSVNGGPWEEIAFVSGTSYVDGSVEEESTYNYQISAVNAAGLEGPLSPPTGEKRITMEITEAEDYNYGGGQYPGYENCPAALEAPDAATVGTPQDYDYFFASAEGETRNTYRPNDTVATEVREATPNIGWTTVGDWWRYSLNVPSPGPNDPPEGWVKVVLKVSSPGGGTVDLYWDEQLVDSLTAITGDWGVFQHVATEDYFQSAAGVHTLRVVLAEGEMNFDTIGMGFNWSAPTRETLFADDFESYTTLYSFADLVGAGYAVNNGSGNPEGAWRLWNTAGNMLNNESPALEAMTNNYAIADSDLAGAVDADEELITPSIDCTQHRRVRLDFNKNFRVYVGDIDHLQIAEVDMRTSDDGVTWSEWLRLLRYDRMTVEEYETSPESVDVSPYADGELIQVRWRFYEANYDYWFAVDDIRISGDKLPPPTGKIEGLGYVAGEAQLGWSTFGGGNYSVEYTVDVAGGNWQPVPGTTWPITETSWSGAIDSLFGVGVYLRVRSD